MGLFLYNISILAYGLLIRVFSLFNPKAAKFIGGRKGVNARWKAHFINDKRPVAWFHAASLGEFEQGKPVLEAFNLLHPQHQIFLSFFSPSGYELRKDYAEADLITYLPLDTATNARQLLDIVKPSVVFFIKYGFIAIVAWLLKVLGLLHPRQANLSEELISLILVHFLVVMCEDVKVFSLTTNFKYF